MISFTVLSLPPETLQRMASHDSRADPGGRRLERAAALAVAAIVLGLAIVMSFAWH
jgi:hypothetical protein